MFKSLKANVFKRSFAVVLLGSSIALPQVALSAQDTINDIPVIERIELQTLARGKIHRFWFKAADTNTGQSWNVPVIINRGAADGPRVLLNSGTHGDELNGIRIAQRIALTLDPATLKGTIIAIPGLNTSGLLNGNRNFMLSRDGGYMSDLNRLMPGTADDGDLANRFLGRVWDKLWKGNVDYVIDLHSQSRGTAYPLFVYVDPRSDGARWMAETLAPDVIKYDLGEKGSAETEFVRQGIPAVTFEIGRPGIWQTDLIERGYQGVYRVIAGLNMLPSPNSATTATVVPYLGNQFTTLKARVGGYAELYVSLLDEVKTGQLLARQINAFGDTVAEYVAPFDGKVLSIGDDPVREPGATIVRIIRWSPLESCKQGC